MATTTLECVTVFVVLYMVTISTASTINLGYKPMRPSFAGATGGNWVNYAGQRVPLGKPWPSRPEDYPSFSATTSKTTLKNGLEETTTEEDSKVTTETGSTERVSSDDNEKNQGTTQEDKTEIYAISTLNNEVDKTTTSSPDNIVTWAEPETTKLPKLPVPNRPPFLGPTGGNFIPQLIPPGKPWPARPEDPEVNNLTTQQSTTTKETTTINLVSDESTIKEEEVHVLPTLPVPNRPPFLGPTGGNFIPQLVPPGKPWPARPEDPEVNNMTTQQSTTTKETTTINLVSDESTIKEEEVHVLPTLPVPNRPPFLGPTGGNFIPQLVPPGKPWPARPEDPEVNNLTTQQSTTSKETTTINLVSDESTTKEEEVHVLPSLPVPNRPPFLGPTGGNFIPQLVPPGKPWPATPEDPEVNNLTTQESTWKETTTISLVSDESTIKEEEVHVLPTLPVPNRPPFLGPTGGNFIPQLVPPGKPWPARPEDYEGFSATSSKPSIGITSKVNEETVSPVDSLSVEVSKPPQPQKEKPVVDKIIFPDDPALDNEINFNSDSQPESNVFSVAFYFGDSSSTRKSESENGIKKPSLSISVNLGALKGGKTEAKTDIMKATKQFLASEKESSSGQRRNNYSVWMNLKDILSSNKSATRINISHLPKKTEEIDKDESFTSKENVIDTKIAKSPLMSVFFNFDDFRSIEKYSTKSKSTKSNKLFTIYRERK